MSQLFFCERVRTSCCISLTNLKKPIILPEIVGFFKFVSEIKQLVPKRSQKNNQEVILHYISVPIYPLDFQKFCAIQKQ